MKAIPFIAIAILLIYSLKIEIKFNPFSFKVGDWHSIVGIILFGIAFYFLNYKSRIESYKQGILDGSKWTIELIKEQANQEESKNTQNENNKTN